MGTCALGRSGLSKDDWVNLCPEVRGTGILTGALWGGVALLRGSTESLCWEWGPQEQRHWSRILRTSLSEERQESREYGVQRGWGADFCGPVKRCRCESGVSLRGSTSARPGVGGRACPVCHNSWEFCQIHEWGFSTAPRTEAPSSRRPRWLTGLFISGVQHRDRTALKWPMGPL